ncbi:Os04g0653100 [Oryza sativa Japonica Group]|uniref:Os04g0653100 protein n=3 Tax=Oryza TaxID=4527 RepID=A0A0P0WFP9_ORYSJ|nr:Os04g0653100 [Oryza sativa Japonica Group]
MRMMQGVHMQSCVPRAPQETNRPSRCNPTQKSSNRKGKKKEFQKEKEKKEKEIKEKKRKEKKRKRKPGAHPQSHTTNLPVKNPHHITSISSTRSWNSSSSMAIATTTLPLAPLALAPPSSPISQCSLLLLRPRAPAALSLRPSARLLVAVAASEPELGGSGGGGAGDGSGSGGGGDSEKPRGGGGDEEGEGEEEKMGQGLSMSQKITLAYAALVGAGGAMGYMKSGSQKSLAAGGISALVLYFVHTQLPVRPVFASSIGLGISAALLSVMGSRFKKSGKIFPAGVVSLVSLVMVGGYIHGILRSTHA